MRKETTHKETYTQCSTTGEVKVEAPEIDITRVRDHTKQLLDSNILDNLITDGKINEKLVNEVLKIDVVSKGGPSGLLSAVVAIAVSCFAGPLGAAMGSALTGGSTTMLGTFIAGCTQGAFMALCSTSALALLNCNGDLGQAFKSIFSSDALKGAMIQAVTMGAGNCFISAYKIPDCTLNRTFTQNVQVGAVRAGAYVTARTILYGEKGLHDIHKEGLNVVIQAVCADLCKDIGVLRSGVDKTGKKFEKMDYFSHKVTHAFVGALGGAVQGEEGMISGAVGAVTGEVLAEAFKPVEQLRSEIYAEHPHYDTLSKTDQWSIIQRKTDTHRKAWKFLSAFAGGLVGGNANVAYQAADTAIENNYIQVAILGLTVAYIGYVGYQVGTEVVNGNYEEALKILGIEVVTFAVGGVVAKGAVAGGKIAFRFVGGTKTYATVAEALSAAYDKTPGLKLCMQSAHNKIVKAFEKFESSSVGQKNISTGAENAADALRLRTELAFQEANILTYEGKLTQEAIQGADKIPLKDVVIKNPKIVQELTKDGSNIADWAKYSTNSVPMPNGQSMQIHFYKNDKTGRIDYLTKDFKVKGDVGL